MPRQVFAIGLNYADHVAEASFAVPGEPAVFTKFPACSPAPPGVGVWRTPQRFLAPGDELVSYVHGIGEMRHVMAA